MNSNYQFTVKPWSIYRLNDNGVKWDYVSRYHKFNHAEGIAKSLQSLSGKPYKVVWNVPKPESAPVPDQPEKMPVK